VADWLFAVVIRLGAPGPAHDFLFQSPGPLVRTFAVTDNPGRNRAALAWSGSSTIFTGIRWTIFVKFPVALSGGNKANWEPLAGEM